ncbi:MAG: hypothetical protein JJ974_05895 [Phycisphaerales bacterium]|nr:hypothetical protein [Phycisphaerales bacterium]
MPPIMLTNDTISLSLDHEHGCNILSLEIMLDDQWTHVMRHGEAGEASFVMLPWTNRIKDARFTFGGREHQLRSNFPDGTAIHGIARDYPWTILDRSPYSARCSFDSRSVEDANFPYDFGSVMRVEIGEGTVEIELSIQNLGDEPMPCGMGHHPHFYRTLTQGEDELEVRVGVDGRYPCEHQIPQGPLEDDVVSAQLRDGGPIGNPDLDDVFGGFDGRAELLWSRSGVRCVMECCDAQNALVVFTPRVEGLDESREPASALSWVCVEPMTMINDGFNPKEGIESGVRVLNPGESLKTTMRLCFTRTA